MFVLLAYYIYVPIIKAVSYSSYVSVTCCVFALFSLNVNTVPVYLIVV